MEVPRPVRNFTRPSGYIGYFINERRSLNSEDTRPSLASRTFLPAFGFCRTSRLVPLPFPKPRPSSLWVTRVPKGLARIQNSTSLPSVIAENDSYARRGTGYYVSHVPRSRDGSPASSSRIGSWIYVVRK